ncbi:type II toxin-antitoxin system HicB family antitoxin [Bacillus horti]|uniref:RNase H-like HicB family nuclease n=1 Tax=Caldalkalibacillus horti TaxID=77523 RepID=A0ABT9W0N2_9BACI|nr:type II toxin-antitoxin system HicB family antitoxin [Bacillus horti]MDQ0166655.1 putative RNase H-like HicB family nuclease [Bacillus horti]
MSNYVFPALFERGIDGENDFTITFPDLPGCITEGSNFKESMYMAKDVLAGYLYALEEDGEDIPEPSESNLPKNSNALVIMIQVTTDIIRDEMENKAIKKTLTIPKWLNDAAEEADINFSQLLQYALKQRLNIRTKDPI